MTTPVTFGTPEANAMIQPALKPCPFCGDTTYLHIEERKREGWERLAWVMCRACSIAGPKLPNLNDAIAEWNTRPNEVTP